MVYSVLACSPGTGSRGFSWQRGGAVLLSISLAGNALANVCEELYNDVGGSALREISWGNASKRFLDIKLEKFKWCPSLSMRLITMIPFEFLYVVYTHGLPPDAEHNMDHSQCASSTCQFTHINTATYRVLHTRKNCPCSILEVPHQQIRTIIEAGGVPLCRFIKREPGNGTPDYFIEVAAASRDRPYIAISHVWAHGSGNPSQNGLPTCSLSVLQSKVSGTLDLLVHKRIRQEPSFEKEWSRWFWMDTLCVPVHSDSKPLRKRTILQIKDIYRCALAVLVFDRDLEEWQPREIRVEFIVRLLLSSWYSRLWTLQEARMARRLMISIQGQAIDLDSFINWFRSRAEVSRIIPPKPRTRSPKFSFDYVFRTSKVCLLKQLR